MLVASPNYGIVPLHAIILRPLTTHRDL